MSDPTSAALLPDLQEFLDSTGARLRYCIWNVPRTRARGSVVLLQGRAEFIEKYAMEVVGELRSRGFAVYALDLRGQGLSDRPLPDHDKGHIDDFATYVADFRLFLTKVVAPTAPNPILVLSHSTGGNIVLRYLCEHGAAAPFAAAAFSSPMVGLRRAWPIRGTLAVLRPTDFFDRRYAPGTGPYDPAKQTFAANQVTHDPRRWAFTRQWFEIDPRLRLGGPTIGWLRQALRSIDSLDGPGVLEKLDLPVLVASAGTDTVVDTAAHSKAVARIPGAEQVTIGGSKHEILMETDERRAQFWVAFDRLAARVA